MDEYEMVTAIIVIVVWIVVGTLISYLGTRYLMRNKAIMLDYDGPCPGLIGLGWPIFIVLSPGILLFFCVMKAQDIAKRGEGG